ncbi:MAG TPA: 6-phosphogluconolactonase [Chloroflexota bacterium]
MTVQIELVELGTPDDLAREAAHRFVEIGAAAIAAHGSFCVALSGGSTPQSMYARLAVAPLRDRLDWSRVQVFFSDERFVPPDSEESNYHTAKVNLIAQVPIPGDHVHRYATVDITPEEAAAQYEQGVRNVLRVHGDDVPTFDLVLLGMGPDGHTASLFPDTEALQVSNRLVTPNFVPKMGAWRLTFTYSLINAARTVAFLVQGDDKKERVREILGGGSPLPAAGVHPSDGRLIWLLDAAAAAEFDADQSGIEIFIANPSI